LRFIIDQGINQINSSSKTSNQINYIRAVLGNSTKEKSVLPFSKNPAAVMVILTEQDDQLQVLFTHRTNSVRTHKDQVSLPGGVMETIDSDLIDTAIRETEEEVGLAIKTGEIIGKLPPVESISNYLIQPFVSFKKEITDLTINGNEVERIFYIPLDWILNRSNWELKKYVSFDKKERMVIYFKTFGGEVVWGITAQIMVNFASALNW
jgi:8-oxo-dGTP pyrophosphatase MutT (NUDIX family)